MYQQEKKYFLSKRFLDKLAYANVITEFYMRNITTDPLDITITFKLAQIGGHYAFEYNQTQNVKMSSRTKFTLNLVIFRNESSILEGSL